MSLALAIALSLAPQGEPVLAGRVVDERGKPVADAKVTLLARPIPRHLDPAHEHRVVATTDAQGAFRAPLHADGVYSVWAATANAATAIAEGESAPGFLELRLLPRTGTRTLPVAGLDAWSEAATFRYRALVGGENLDFVPVACREGALLVPPLPPLDQRTIEVLVADDRVLWAMAASDKVDSVVIPAPESWVVHAADDKGAALAGVEVLAHICNYWATDSEAVQYGDRFRDLWPSQGRTDDDGKLTIRRPTTDQLWLMFRKDGFVASTDGYANRKVKQGGVLVPVDPARDHFEARLRPAPALVLPLATAKGTPLAMDTLFVTSRVQVRSGDDAHFGIPFSFALPVVDGRASTSALPVDTKFEGAATTFVREVREQLRERFGFAPSALRVATPAALATGVAFDPEQWHALTVITSDGRPAANTPVFLSTTKKQGTMRRTDRLGRLLLESAAPQRVSVYGRDGVGTAIVEGRETKLALTATRPTPVRVIDLADKPVAGMRVGLEIQAQSSDDAGQYELLARLMRCWSDAEGRVEVPMPPFAAHVVLNTAWSPHVPRLEFDWDPAKPPELVLTVPRQ